MANESTGKNPEQGPANLWRRALKLEGNDPAEAIKEFGEKYWYCVYVWWRRAGLDPITAATATAASFNIWANEKPPKMSDPNAENMRVWTALRLHEMAQEGIKLQGDPLVQIDQKFAEKRYSEEPEGDPLSVFQRRWALTVLEITTITLREEYEARNEADLFHKLHEFAGFNTPDEDRYAAVAQEVGMTTGAIKAGVFQLRTRQREIMLQVVKDTLLSAPDAENEITALLCSCDAPGPAASEAPLPTVIQDVNPDEVLAQAMNSIKMTQTMMGEWQPPTLEEMKTLFPQYDIISLVGRGGMGAVYKARQIELDRTCAIKLLPLEVSVDQNFADRFRREARAMAKLHHQNIILVYEFGTTSEGHLFFVMEFVEGADLHQMIHGPGVSTAQALHIIVGVCDALAYAHDKGVVHRDIKPANVMVSVNEEVKVADFGLARLLDPDAEQMGYTMTGTIMGTPDYMAPEQRSGMNVDHRADIYSLGVMLYEMLCKEVPRGIFQPPSARKDDVGMEIDEVVTKAMQQQPESRYQTTQEMKTDVAAASEVKTPASKKKPAKPPRVKKQRIKKPREKKEKKPKPQRSAAAGNKNGVIIGSIAAVAALLGMIFLVPWSGKDDKEKATGTPPADAPQHQTIDLMTLADPAKDTIRSGNLSGANRWEKSEGMLAYRSDGKAGKIASPVSLQARNYEIEVGFRRGRGEDRFHIDLPVTAKRSVPLEIGRNKSDIVLGGKKIGATGRTLPLTKGLVVARLEGTPGLTSILTVLLDGEQVASWSGDLSAVGKEFNEPHPDYPSEPITTLWCAKDSYEFTKWELRVYDGKAKVLRHADTKKFAATDPKAGDRKIIPIANGVDIAMRWCPPGKFVMGSPEDELGRTQSELYKPLEEQRDATIDQGFWMGELELTQAQWIAVMQKNPSQNRDAQLPVERVTFIEAREFCRKLTGVARESGAIPAGWRFSLPTVAQWEYACRAGTTSALNSGKELTQADGKCAHVDEVAWYNGNSDNKSHQGGQKLANRWGIHDMHGNVAEWCDGYLVRRPPRARLAPNSSPTRFMCGSAFSGPPYSHRSAARKGGISNAGEDSKRWHTVGFRVALVKAQKTPQASEPLTRPGRQPGAQLSATTVTNNHMAGYRLLAPLAPEITMPFRACPPGSFIMGSPENELGRERINYKTIGSETQKKVEITRGFWIGETEVTNAQWTALMNNRPSTWKGDKMPVQTISWSEANAFCAKLTEQLRKSGRLPSYDWIVTIPTDAQWEYACRAGTTSALNSGKNLTTPDSCPNMGELAWYSENSTRGTGKIAREVARLKPNNWGIYDMHGNVSEYCVRSDLEFPPEGDIPVEKRIVRGGTWTDPAHMCRSAFRPPPPISLKSTKHGLRVILIQKTKQDTGHSISEAKQTLDLIDLVDLGRDLVTLKPSGNAAATTTEESIIDKKDGSLRINIRDHKPVIITPPVAIHSKDYEIEVDVWRQATSHGFHIYLPVSGSKVAPLRIWHFGRLVSLEKYFDWEAKTEKRLSGKFRVRVTKVTDTDSEVTVYCDDVKAGQWKGDLSAAAMTLDEPHPDFQGEPVLGLFSGRTILAFRSWKLRVFEGEAKVLRKDAADPFAPEQTINMLDLVDPVKDRIHTRFTGSLSALSTGNNRWEKKNGTLAYRSDGKPGKIAAPVAIRSDDFEIEVGFKRNAALQTFHMDIPVPGAGIVPVEVGHMGSKIKLQYAATWDVPALKNSLSGTVKLRIKNASGENSEVTAYFDGKVIGDWKGKLSTLGKATNEKHPGYPDEPVTSFWCRVHPIQITSWVLRSYDGKAKVLRGTGANDSGAGIENNPFINTLGMKFVPITDLLDRAKAAGHRVKGDSVAFDGQHAFNLRIPAKNVILRVSYKAEWFKHVVVHMRVRPEGASDRVKVYETSMQLSPHGKPTAILNQRPPKEGVLEIACIENQFRARLGGETISAELNPNPGKSGILLQSSSGVYITGVEYINLDTVEDPLRCLRQDPDGATKDKPITNTLGMKFVPVPIAGGPTDGKRVLFGIWPTRVRDYEQFVKDTGHEWRKPKFEQSQDHPAVMVSWDDAQAFCAWLTQRERKAGNIATDLAYRLPTDHEWSCAFGIGGKENPNVTPWGKGQIKGIYPWGTQWPPPKNAGNFSGDECKALVSAGKYIGSGGNIAKNVKTVPDYNDGNPYTSPVGSYLPNPFGLYDMAGNVRQYCADEPDQYRALRGSSWSNSEPLEFLSSKRGKVGRNTRLGIDGFRCVLAPVSDTKQSSTKLPAWIDPELPKPGPDGWITIFDGKVLRGATITDQIEENSVRLEAGRLVVEKTKVNIPLPHKDVILRLTARNEKSGMVLLDLRRTEDTNKRAYFYTSGVGRFGKEVAMSYYDPRHIKLTNGEARINYKEDFVTEFKAIGNQLDLLLQGKNVLSATNDRFSRGDMIAIGGLSGPASYKRIEVKVLDSPDPTELKASFQGRRYQFVPGNISWPDAKRRAESMGGHLATITSKEEFDWVVKTFRQPLDEGKKYSSFWIGGIRENANSGWKWVTGEPITNPFWAPNQPDVGRGEQGGFPAYLNLHRPVSKIGFNDSSDTAKPHRHWRNETVGFLVEWSSDKETGPQGHDGHTINLLPLIDPSKDTVDGTWKKENGVLTVQATNSANIEIPYRPPAEYDFRVTFVRHSGNRSVNQILTKNRKTFVWDFYHNRWGFYFIGKTNLDNPTVRKRPFVNGQRYTSTVHVRNDGFSVTVDGELVSSWKTDYKEMRITSNWALRDPTLLGLGSDRNVTTFEKVELIEITGKGKPAR